MAPFKRGEAPTAFFTKTYDEALDLLVAMRDYAAQAEPRDRADRSPAQRVRLSCASLRATARLTQIMAWLLAQKAVHAAEPGAAELLAKSEPLAELAQCMAAEGEAELEGLPGALRELLGRSHRLYVRVARLDEMVRRQSA